MHTGWLIVNILPKLKTSQAGQQGAMQMAEEQWSVFIAGLIYELDLLGFFIEWITAYPTSSCVNSYVQGEGKKIKGRWPKA